MNEDEEILFQQEMAGVTPIETQTRVGRRAAAVSAEAMSQRRDAAVAESGDPNHLSDEGVEALDPWYVLEFKRPGVQNGVFRKLKQGRYEAEARLNLHRMTVKQARREIYEFVAQASELGLRTVLIIHGKGENSGGPDQAQASVVKGYVDHWLRELDVVQAFHSARPAHGGTGAVYVLLRKSESAKQANRERFRS